MRFVEVRFAGGIVLWFEIPAGMTRNEAIDFFLAPGRFEAEGIGDVQSVGSPVDAVPEGETLQPRFPGLDFSADTGGGGGGDPDPSPPGSVDRDRELQREAFEFGPGFERGLRQRGINIGGGGGIQGRIAGEQQRSLEDRFIATEAFRPGGQPASFPTFENFLSGTTAGTGQFTNPLFGQGGANAARALLQTAQDQGMRFGDDQLPSLLAGGILNPATVAQGSTLGNIARDAGRQRFGSLSRFLPSGGALANTFLSGDQVNPAGVPLSFADFLNRRIFG